MWRLFRVAAAAAALLGGSVPAASGTVLRGLGQGAHSLAGAEAAAGKDSEGVLRASRPAVELTPAAPAPVDAAEEESSWYSSAASRFSEAVTDTPRRVLVRMGFMQTPKQKPQPGSVEPHIVIDHGVDDREVKQQQAVAWLIMSALSVAVWTGLTCLIARYFLNNKLHPEVDVDPGAREALSSFRFGPFDCLSRMDISLWVCCCPAIRWADNISTMGLLRSFWLALAVFLGFQMVTSESQDLIAWTILAVIGALFRKELRLKFEMTTSGQTFFQDCLLYCCCPCCAITQEARQVEEAIRAGHPAVAKPGEAAA